MSTYEHKIECLERAAESAPEYRDIVPLFIGLYRFLSESSGRSGISVTSAAEGPAERLRAGFPIVAPGDLQVDIPVCTEFISGSIAVLRAAGREGEGELNALESALREGRLDLKELFGSVLERRRAALDETSQSAGMSAALLEYVLEIPLKAALEQFALGIDAAVTADWKEALCPVCGSRPGMAELTGEEGRRMLCCSACSFQWPYKRLQCPYCGNEDAQKLSYFTAGEDAVRVDVCSACSRYIKTRDSRKAHADVPMDVEDLLSIHLDLLAAREGYERGK